MRQIVQMKDQTVLKCHSALCNIPHKSTCSSETSVTVDRYLSLLQREGHDLHHVQNSGEVGHSVVAPAEVVEIYWNSKMFEVSLSDSAD